MTSEQLEAARAERMRQNGHGTLTLEDARTWMEETGLCLFLPKRQFSTSLAPSFVEAIAGQRNQTPEPKQIALAEELLVRLELDGVAVRLNLLGQPGEQPDYVVAAWVLPYVYALRGDRDWRRSPQLTGSRQVSQLAIQAYKRLEQGDATIAELKTALAQGVSEMAVLRAITELWQQLRIIPVIAAPGKAAKWQLLKQRFQKAIAEGASTSQVTAISVLASIFLQAVIAASMEEVEVFLSPLTARSKIREVLRGLVATRQVHTLSLGHAPHFYVAGTLPEFSVTPTLYANSASSYLPHYHEQEDSYEPEQREYPHSTATEVEADARVHGASNDGVNKGTPRITESEESKTAVSPQRHPSRIQNHRDHKPAAGNGRSARRPAEGRSGQSRPASSSRPAAGARWSSNGTAKRSNGAHTSSTSHGAKSPRSNGSHASTSAKPARTSANGHGATRAAGNGHAPARGAKPGAARTGWGSARPATNRPASGRPANGRPTAARPGAARPGTARPAAPRPGSSHSATARPGSARPGSNKTASASTRAVTGARKEARGGAGSARKPALAAGYAGKAGSKKRG